MLVLFLISLISINGIFNLNIEKQYSLQREEKKEKNEVINENNGDILKVNESIEYSVDSTIERSPFFDVLITYNDYDDSGLTNNLYSLTFKITNKRNKVINRIQWIKLYNKFIVIDARQGNQEIPVNSSISYDITFEVPKKVTLPMTRVGIEEDDSTEADPDVTYSKFVTLSTEVKPITEPKISNINVVKNIDEPNKIKLTWTYTDGDTALVDQSTISGKGIPSGSIKIIPTAEEKEIDNVSFNTLADDWSINLAYNKSGSVQTDNYPVPDFVTYEENMTSLTTFTYGTIVENKVNIDLNISNLTSSYFTYTNFTFTSKSTGLNVSKDENITSDGDYEFSDIPLIEGRLYDDLMVEITVKDDYFTASYSQSLSKIVVPPNIINFNDVINKTTGEIVLSWDIKDDQNLFQTLTLYDEDKKEDVRDLSTTEISEKKISFIGLDGDIDLKLSIKGKWTSGSDSGTSTSNIISFTTIWAYETAPVVNSFEVLNINDKQVDLNWTITDVDKNIIKVYLYDETSKTEIHEMTESEISNSKATISGLTPETSYSWTLRVVWEDSHYSGEKEISSEIITFTTLAVTIVAPTIDSFTYSNLTSTEIDLNWSITDVDETITKIYLYDESSKTEIHEMTTSEIIDSKTTISGLTPRTNYSWTLRVQWNDTYYNAEDPEISSETINFTTLAVATTVPTIDSFDYNNLTSSGVNINWTITDNDNNLSALYLYDLNNDKIFKTGLEDLSGTIFLNNLIQGEEYNLELRGTWTDKISSSGEIKSDDNIVFTIPYEHKTTPTIEKFDISNITTETVLVSWNYTDLDNVVVDGKIYDETNHEDIHLLSKEELKKGSITINIEKMDKLQDWSLKLNWTDPFYGNNIVTSEIKEFEIPEIIPDVDKHFDYWLILLLLIFILTIIMLYVFTNSKKNKWV